MTTLTPDDELLIILLRNLQNAAATFGESAAQYESVRDTVEEHLRDMKRNNRPTNITKAREVHSQGSHQQSLSDEVVLQAGFANLAIRPRTEPQGRESWR